MFDLDNTKRSCFASCPRMYYWQYVLNLRPIKGSTAIRYGVAWHAMMEAMYKDIKKNGWRDPLLLMPDAFAAGKKAWERESADFDFAEDYRSLDQLSRSFFVYINTFTNDPGMLKIIEAEKVFEITMEPESKEEEFIFKFYDAEPFLFTGKIDLQVELNGPSWIFEHKTTSQYLGQAVARLHRSPQQMGYVWASKRLGIDIEGLLVCIHHLSARKNTKGGWGDAKIEFQRVPQLFSSEDLADWRESFIITGCQAQAARRNEIYQMVMDSCYNYGGCPYSILCEQNTRPLLERNMSMFVEKVWDVRNESGLTE